MTCEFGFKKFTFVDQTAALTNETLFTPSVDGDYIVGISSECVGADASGDIAGLGVVLNWSGADGEYMGSIPGSSAYHPAGNPQSLINTPLTIHAVAGVPVTITTTWSSVAAPVGAQNYSVYVTVIGG